MKKFEEKATKSGKVGVVGKTSGAKRKKVNGVDRKEKSEDRS